MMEVLQGQVSLSAAPPEGTTCLLLGDLGKDPGRSGKLHLLADLRRLGCGCAGAQKAWKSMRDLQIIR